MSKHRLLFSKTGRAIYISHLDIMSTFQRAFMRTGASVKHTEGYNPHAFVSIALPLSLGHSSRCEFLDFELLEDKPKLEDLPGIINQYLPEGIVVHEAYENGQKLKELTYIAVRITLTYDNGVGEGHISAISELFNRPELTVTKKSKKGPAETDIAPLIKELNIEQTDSDKIVIDAVITAQNPSLNPTYITAAIAKYLPEFTPDFAEYERIEAYDADMNRFR